MPKAAQATRPRKFKLRQIDEWRVLDRRVVGVHEGKMLVWLLVVADDGASNWKPYYLAEDGVTILEEPSFCPLPGSQYVFLSSPIFETLYAGNRGGGKCVDEGEVLTPDRGWVDIRKMQIGDLVYTFDADGEMMVSVVSDTHVEDYDGDLVRCTSNRFYASFTPLHKLAITQPGGHNLLVPFEQLPGQADLVRATTRFPGTPLNPLLNGSGASVGWWFACGRWHHGKPELNFPTPKAKRAFEESHAMMDCWKNNTDHIPREYMNSTPEVLRQLLEALIRGSGLWRKVSVDGIFNTMKKALADDVSEIGVKLGFNVSVRQSGIGSGGRHTLYSVSLTPAKPKRLQANNLETEHFTGKVYCIEVPLTHSFILRQRGSVWLSGNSDSLLLSFASGVGKGYGKGYRGILFRKEFGDLDDIVRKVETIFPRIYGEGFRFLKSKSEYTAIWKTGEALLLRNLPNEDAYREYHGHSYAWMGFEELTQWPDDKVYKLMFSCLRSPEAGVPVIGVRATTNPYGIGHNWVKKRFRLPHGFGKVIRNPGEDPRVAIQSDLRENFVLLHNNPGYPNRIRSAASNPAQEKAWVDGDWDVTTGGMFDDLWNNHVHVIPNVVPMSFPMGWRLNRSYDHGSSKPFCVLWWAESNGEPAHFSDGRVVGQVRGDIILFAEWYGTTGQPDTGVRMSASSIAKGILERQRDWRISHRVKVGPADANIYTKDTRTQTRSPADDMEDAGVWWERADMSSGSRSRGYQMIRARLAAAYPSTDGTRDTPGLFVCQRCEHWLELVPSAPRDPANQDELPKGYEDHPVDATRYRMTHDESGVWQRGF